MLTQTLNTPEMCLKSYKA